MDLLQLDQDRKDAETNIYLTLYDKIQLHYTYMEYLLDHKDLNMDIDKLLSEIEVFQEKCSVWVTLYEEAIYPQFAQLLTELRVQILILSDKNT